MTHTLHPEIKSKLLNIITIMDGQFRSGNMQTSEKTRLWDILMDKLGPYLLPPSQHANIDKIMEDMEQYHITHYLSGRDVVLPSNIRQVLEKHLLPTELKEEPSSDGIVQIGMSGGYEVYAKRGVAQKAAQSIRGDYDDKYIPEPIEDAPATEHKQCTACLGKKQHSVYSQEVGHDDFGGEGYAKKPQVKMMDCGRCNGTGEEPTYNEKAKTYTFEQMEAEYDRGFTNGLLAIGGKKEELKQSTPKIEPHIQKIQGMGPYNEMTVVESKINELIDDNMRLWDYINNKD